MPYVSHNIGDWKKHLLLTALREHKERLWHRDKDAWEAATKLYQDIYNAEAVTLITEDRVVPQPPRSEGAMSGKE